MLVGIYVDVLRFLAQSSKYFRTPPTIRLMHRASSRKPWPGFSRDVEQLRESAKAVLKEVEYLDRRETRIASTRLKFMEKDQQKILLAVEEQKKIMSNLQEQQQMLEMVKDQQEVLQRIQNLLIQLRPIGPSDTAGQVSGASENSADGSMLQQSSTDIP
jgi:seryl-tRNA synthetase